MNGEREEKGTKRFRLFNVDTILSWQICANERDETSEKEVKKT